MVGRSVPGMRIAMGPRPPQVHVIGRGPNLTEAVPRSAGRPLRLEPVN